MIGLLTYMRKESLKMLGAAIILGASSVGVNPQVPQADLVGIMRDPHELQANKEVPRSSAEKDHEGNRITWKGKKHIKIRKRG